MEGDLLTGKIREGDLLAGKYRIERVLGVGGMGVVVAARHEQLGQLVAIKFVREDALANDDAIERFLREARSAVRLKSEHVARVIDVGKLESGAPYMVMEFLDGEDLGQVLEDRGPMAPEAAVQLLLQACEAVAEAHNAGIVHRDLKPQNLFLTHTIAGQPRLKVLDFGVSKSSGMTSGGQGALTRTRSMLGSPLYMSPEQMRSAKDTDARTDVWALGVVLFELLTRRWPFEAQNMPELCLKVVTEAPQSIAALRPDLPPGLVTIIERCLMKDPGARYADAAALAQALDPYAPHPAPRRTPSSASFADAEAVIASVSNETLVSPRISSQVTPPGSSWDPVPQNGVPSDAGTSKSRRVVLLGAVLAAGFVVSAAFGLSRLTQSAPAAQAPAPHDIPTQTVILAPRPAELPATTTRPAPELPVPTEAPSASLAALPEGGPPRAVSSFSRPAKGQPHQAPQPKLDDDIPALR